MPATRRDFLLSAAFWAGDDVVRFTAEIERLVRKIEDIDIAKCADLLRGEMTRGTTYDQFLSALFLAGIRNINPNPCGFALHCVFVVHSAHHLAMQAPKADRIMALHFALRNFKESQARDAKASSGDFVLKPLRGTAPASKAAAAEFEAAMEAWDRERAQLAVAALLRERNPEDVIEMLWRYGARDYRNIGHKAIFVANASRTLRTIGWKHAEPVLRSLVIGILDYARTERVNGFTFEDQTFLANEARLKNLTIGRNWQEGHTSKAAALDVFNLIRNSSPEDACGRAAAMMSKGSIAAGDVWTAVHLSASDMMVRKPASFIGVHAVTSMNAMHHAGVTSRDPRTRALVLLQAIGWAGQFGKWYGEREKDVLNTSITELTPASASIEETLADIGTKPSSAAARALTLARDPARVHDFKSALRNLVFTRGNEAHYYKYAAALFEDYQLVRQDLSGAVLASAVLYMKPPTAPKVEWAEA